MRKQRLVDIRRKAAERYAIRHGLIGNAATIYIQQVVATTTSERLLRFRNNTRRSAKGTTNLRYQIAISVEQRAEAVDTNKAEGRALDDRDRGRARYKRNTSQIGTVSAASRAAYTQRRKRIPELGQSPQYNSTDFETEEFIDSQIARNTL